MQPKNTISDAISNYYFHQQPRVPSLCTRQPLGKENAYSAKNLVLPEKYISHKQLPLQEFKNSSPTHAHYYSVLKAPFIHPSSQQNFFHTKLVPYASSLQRNNPKEKRCESTASLKKSVKFVEKIENFGGPTQNVITNRSRSNSILKSRSVSKDSQKIRSMNHIKCAISADRRRDHKNAGIKQRYRQIINELGKDTKLRVTTSIQNSTTAKYLNKYIDPSFPPLQHSISDSNLAPRITWRRISEIPSFSSSIVRSKQEDNGSVIIRSQKEQCHSLSIALKLLKNCPKLLDFIFEDLKYNQKGAYLLRIFQETDWRYVIIDDYVPIQEKNGTNLAFISIEGHETKQIWPLLLQKAYAAYLGSYQKLHHLTLPQLFNNLLRLPTQPYTVDQNSLNNLIQSFSKDSDCVLYAELKEPFSQKNIYKQLRICKDNEKVEFFQINEDNTQIHISMSELAKKYKKITKVLIPNFQTFTSIEAAGPNNIGRQIKNKYMINFSNESEVNYEQFISRILVKSFTLQSMDQCTFIIKNYDKSLRKKDENDWARVLLFQKELDSFRWIIGKYSNSVISFSCLLQPAKYYLILIPDKKQEANLNFLITTYGKFRPITFHPEHDLNVPSAIEKGCSDLAQRTGKMTQINKWICTYTLVNAEAGIIIENINNQRRNGSIRIFRTIKNLKTKNSFIVPFNKEFYSSNQAKLKEQAQILIEKQDSSSIILLLFGGSDPDFLKNFNFGL